MDIKHELHKVEVLLICMGVGYLAFAFFLHFNPEETKEYFGLILAAVLLIFSITVLIMYFRKERVLAALSMDFTRGFLLLAAGIFFLVRRSLAKEYLVEFAVVLLFMGALIKLQKAIDLWRIESNWWIVVLVLAVISMAGSVLFLLELSFVGKFQNLLMVIFFGIDGAASLICSLIFGLRLRKAIRMNDGFMMEPAAHSLAPWLHKSKAETEAAAESAPAPAEPAEENEDPFEE